MKYLIYVFYLEILINFASGGQSLFMPAAFLGQFSSEPAPAFALEMTRWYGVLIVSGAILAGYLATLPGDLKTVPESRFR